MFCTHQWGGVMVMQSGATPEAQRGLSQQRWWSWAGAAWAPPVPAPAAR